MGFKLKTRPPFEPVTLQQAKDHLRVDDDLEDALIIELIKTARDHVEAIIHGPIITQTWALYNDMFDGVVQLKPQLQSVQSIKYIDCNGAQQVLADTEYDVDDTAVVGTVYPRYGKEWPDTRNQINAVEIEFVAGYGVADDVPSSIKSAILLLVGHWFVNRESVIVGVSPTETPMAVEALLNPYTVIYF